MKRSTLHRLAASLHRFIAVNTIQIHAEIVKKQAKNVQHECEGKDDDVF